MPLGQVLERLQAAQGLEQVWVLFLQAPSRGAWCLVEQLVLQLPIKLPRLVLLGLGQEVLVVLVESVESVELVESVASVVLAVLVALAALVASECLQVRWCPR